MADNLAPYPPSPPNVLRDLTTPTARYRLRVLVVLTSLLLFAALYLGLVAGSAYFCYWSIATQGGSTTTGQYVLNQASLTEERLAKLYNETLQQRQQNKIDDNGFLQVLEHDILPPWRAQRQRLADVRGQRPEEQRLVEQYATFFRLREESWELLAQAIRHQDAGAAEAAQQKARESDQLARQFSTDAQRYYRNRPPPDDGHSFWTVVAGIGSGLLCLFLVKGFFKWRRAAPAQQLEVTEQDQPALFAFLRRLCAETRAPMPYRVYLTPEVNAAVFYRESLLSLFLPARKNLVIGLGLVNQLNLSEFKAVLAHELGHFSQNSMKLGSYVYMSNRVITDIVFGRDWLDDVVTAVCGFDFRLAMFAWVFVGALWVLRATLQGLFRLLNFANSALSRQMEFNADLVAVSVTGSDALIHALARLDFAGEALGQAWHDLTAAADHQLYSRDVFYHQSRAAAYLRTVRKDPRLGEPPVLPEDPRTVTQVFQPADTSVPKMWATHPTNHDREVNAKRYYIRSPIDERSAWILFQAAPALCERVTQSLYATAWPARTVQLAAPEIVQEFIDAEHTETTYHPRYHGLYDQRYLTPGDLEALVNSATRAFASAEHLAEAHARLYDDALKVRVTAHQQRQEDCRRLASLAQHAVKDTGKDFQFRGARYSAADAGKLLEQVNKELEQDFEWMGMLDRRAFTVHHEMARQLGEGLRRELVERYRFQLALQQIIEDSSFADSHLRVQLAAVAGQPQLAEQQFNDTVAVLQWAHDMLRQQLEAAQRLRLPVLKNVTPGESLGTFLMNRSLLSRLSGAPNCLAGDWVGRFLVQMEEVLARARRLHFKSLGGILTLQENIADQWSALGREHCQDADEAGQPKHSIPEPH